MKEKVIIIGDGGHAKIVVDILQEMNLYEIIGVTSIDSKKKEFYGLPVLGDDSVLGLYYQEGVRNIAIGIGGFKDNKIRTNIYNNYKIKGFRIVNVIHPNSVIAKTVQLGEGVTIFAGVIINGDVKVGNNVILATGATIDHESFIDDNVLISAGVTVGANTTIGVGSLCALGSKIISGVKIGTEVLVAAGAVVVDNISDNSTVFGIPAKSKE